MMTLIVETSGSIIKSVFDVGDIFTVEKVKNDYKIKKIESCETREKFLRI
jgi:hypothetical protein